MLFQAKQLYFSICAFVDERTIMGGERVASGGIVFLPSYYEAMRNLPDTERLLMYDTILDYGINDVEPNGLTPLLQAIFTLIRPNLDSSKKRYVSSVENGKKGGRPPSVQPRNKNLKKPSHNLTEPNQNQDKDMEKEMEIEKEMEQSSRTDKPSGTRFVPPTLKQVKERCVEKGYRISPEVFFNYYEANGWVVGKAKMKKWESALANWNAREMKPKGNSKDGLIML